MRSGWLVIGLSVAAFFVWAMTSGNSEPTSSGEDDEIGYVQDFVRDGYGDKSNTIVRGVTCERQNADHFSCDLRYETPEGVTATTTVAVTCDADRCVWRG